MSKKKLITITLMVQFLLGAGITCAQTRTARSRMISSLDRDCVADSIIASTDDLHFAYVVRRGFSMYVIRDRKQDFNYDFIKTDSLAFSPDGRHLAYIISQSTNNWNVVLDGSVLTSMNVLVEIKDKSLVFSPDGSRLAYVARNLSKWFVVVDGKEGPQFDDINEKSLAFSPDGEHLAYIAKNYNKYTVVIDDEKGTEYDYMPDWTHLVWRSSTRLHYLLLDINNDVYVISETVK